MKLLNLGITAAALVLAGDFAGSLLPAGLDLGNMPVREYGGAMLGVYGAHALMHEGVTDPAKVAVEGAAGRFVSDLAGRWLPDSVDVFGLPVRRVVGAAAGLYLSQASGAEKAIAKVV